MPVFFGLGVLVCLYVLFHVGVFVWAVLADLQGQVRGRDVEREHRRIEAETARTVRQIDELTERAAAALMAAAMEHRHGNAR